jgi:hypothetical protein
VIDCACEPPSLIVSALNLIDHARPLNRGRRSRDYELPPWDSWIEANHGERELELDHGHGCGNSGQAPSRRPQR